MKDLCLNIFAVVSLILIIAIVYFKWATSYWSRRGVSTPPTSFPFGSATDLFLQKRTFGEDMKHVYLKMKSKGLKYCGYYFFIKPTLLILDADLAKTVLIRDFANFIDRGMYVNEEIDPLSGHLFALRGAKWKTLRAKLTPTFTSGKMKMMFQTLIDCSDELVVLMDKMAEQGQAVDIKEIVGRFTTDVIGSCAFGINCNSLKDPGSEFRGYGKKVFELGAAESFKRFLAICFPEMLSFLKVPLNRADVTKFFLNVVERTVRHREENNVIKKDFMHLLIQLKNNAEIKDGDAVGDLNVRDDFGESPSGKALTVEEVAAQAFVFFLAGFESSSTTLCFCFYELVSNLEIQDKLREEINEVLGRHGGRITYNAVVEMAYMDKCIRETLRKYPPVPVLFRECKKTHELPGSKLILSKGTMVFVPVLGIHHDPEYYPDSDTFDPERFSAEGRAGRPPCTWLPFGEGPRTCIGYRFGLMQAKVALAVLLRNFRFSLNGKTQLPLRMNPKDFVLTAQGGVWLDVKKVTKK